MTDKIPTTSRPGWARIEAEHDIAEAHKVLGHPLLLDLLKLWAQLCRNGEPPAREDVDDLIYRPSILPNIFLLEGVERSGGRDLRYSVIGKGLAASFGSDMTGRYARDIFADQAYAEELISVAFLVMDGRRPIATTGRYFQPSSSDAAIDVHRLGLPLKPLASGTPTLLVCQVSLMGGEIIEVAPHVPYSYEPGSVVAFVDRSSGRSQPT